MLSRIYSLWVAERCKTFRYCVQCVSAWPWMLYLSKQQKGNISSYRKLDMFRAYAALQNQLDRRNWAAVPRKLNNGTARIEQSHRSGWIWAAQNCQGIIKMVGLRCLAAPSACAWIPWLQWPRCRHRGRFGRRWYVSILNCFKLMHLCNRAAMYQLVRTVVW